VLALFEGIGVGHELEEPFAKIKIVYQCRALRRCAVAGNPFPLRFLGSEKPRKRVAKSSDAIGEIIIERYLTDAERCLVGKQRIQSRRSYGRRTYRQPQRVPMNGKPFYVI